MSNNGRIALGLAALAVVLSAGVVYSLSSPSGGLGQNSGMRANPTGLGSAMMGGAQWFGGMMGGGTGMMGTNYGMMGSSQGMMGGCGTQISCSQMMSRGRSASNGTRNMVVMMNNAFIPLSLTISKGTVVTWVNMDFVQHTVTSGSEQAPTNLFDSHELGHMQTFSYKFDATGTYLYYCDIHPGMVGSIVVTG